MLTKIGFEKNRGFILFSFIAFLLCLFYSMFYQPRLVSDSSDYIMLAKEFLGHGDTSLDLSNRSPLYSMLIIPFLKIFGEAGFLYPLMYFHFFLIFLCSMIVFKIFDMWERFKSLPYWAGFLFLITFSTTWYGHLILSETLGLFIFILLVYFAILYAKQPKFIYLALIALLNVLTVLARFNMLGIPYFTFICLLVIYIRQWPKLNLLRILMHIASYIVIIMLLFSVWKAYNYYHRGYWGIRPKNLYSNNFTTLNENISPTTKVSPEYQYVFQTYLQVRDSLLAYQRENYFPKTPQTSLLRNPFFASIYKQIVPVERVNGYGMFIHSRPLFMAYYHLPEGLEGSLQLKKILDPFYDQLRLQYRKEILQRRYTSLLLSLRIPLPFSDSDRIILPSIFIVFFKMMSIVINICVYIGLLFYLLLNFWKIRKVPSLNLGIYAIYIFYFPIANYRVSTVDDALRYKSASEFLVIGCMLYFIYFMIEKIKLIKQKHHRK